MREKKQKLKNKSWVERNSWTCVGWRGRQGRAWSVTCARVCHRRRVRACVCGFSPSGPRSYKGRREIERRRKKIRIAIVVGERGRASPFLESEYTRRYRAACMNGRTSSKERARARERSIYTARSHASRLHAISGRGEREFRAKEERDRFRCHGVSARFEHSQVFPLATADIVPW